MDASVATPPASQEAAAPPTAARPSLSEIRADQAAHREARRRRDASWRPYQSVAFREVTLTLRSAAAQRVFHLGLVHAQRSLYFLYHTLQSQGGDEAVTAAETIIHKKFVDLQQSMEMSLKRLQTVAKSIEADPVSGYTGAVDMTVQMYTAEADTFGRLITMFDDVVLWADTLRFAAGLKRKELSQLVAGHRNHLVSFSRQIHLLFLQSRNAARRADRAREEAYQARLAAREAKRAATAEAASAEHSSESSADEMEAINAPAVVADDPDTPTDAQTAAEPAKPRARRTKASKADAADVEEEAQVDAEAVATDA